MKYCSKCGTQLADDVQFCPSCGAATAGAPENTGYAAGGESDAQQNKAMGILAYLGILVLIPIFAAKNSPFARFHANQGLVLAICEIGYAIVSSILSAIFTAISPYVALVITSILNILSIAFLVLSIIGIVNAAKGETKELPIVGKLRILK